MKRMIQKKRQNVLYPLPVPISLETLDIPDQYKKTLGGDNFLIHDSGPTRQRIIIFGTMRNLELMENTANWFADGTFKVSPNLFEQVYTIHGVHQNNVIPLCFALLPNKTEETYIAMLTALKMNNIRLNPETVMTDFEIAAMNAFQAVFPETRITGCFFHMGQCIWRRLQRYPDLQRNYKLDGDFALKVKMLTALAFVPAEDVIESFELLTLDAFYSATADIVGFMDYFEDTWIGQPVRRGRRREPLFGINVWNCFYRVTDGIAKTNNSVEGWHRGFHSMLGSDHPTIWRLIDGLKKEQSVNEVRIAQYHAGQNPSQSRKRYRDLAFRLKQVVENYGTIPTIDYLRAIAQNLNLAV